MMRKQYGRLVRLRGAVASFDFGLQVLRRVCLSSSPRRRKDRWRGEQDLSFNMRGRKPFPKRKQGKLLLASERCNTVESDESSSSPKCIYSEHRTHNEKILVISYDITGNKTC